MLKNIDQVCEYFKAQEKAPDNLRMGVEFEHLLLDSQANARSYYDAGGSRDLFLAMIDKGWKGNFEGEFVLSIKKDGLIISTEPGGQLEFSTDPLENPCEVKSELFKFYRDAIDALEPFDSHIYTLGFQPLSDVDDIKILPKERYYAMYNYFKTAGAMGKFMMKGTASVQVSLDFLNEKDYGRKYALANKLSNILYILFDNVAFKGGRPIDVYAFRSMVWNNTDRKRCGTFEAAFRPDFKYEDYAKFLLSNDAIFTLKDGVFHAFDGTIDQAMTGASKEEMEHLMTMVFPDVRTKRFIEIRQLDSIPYPYNLGAVALLNSIFYNNDNMDRVYNLIGDLTFKESERARLEMYEKGTKTKMMGKTMEAWGVDILSALDIKDCFKPYIEKIVPLMEGNTLRRQQIDRWKTYATCDYAIEICKMNLEDIDV